MMVQSPHSAAVPAPAGISLAPLARFSGISIASCQQHNILQLLSNSHVVWLELSKNSYISVAPHFEKLFTLFCGADFEEVFVEGYHSGYEAGRKPDRIQGTLLIR
ncbi:MAG: hypothetical protein V8R75_09570 [Oscillospiraceae bacterium]